MQRILLPVILLALILFGCDSGDVIEQEVAQVQVRLELDNLPVLQDGFHYQAWAKIGFEYFGTDSFNKAENGGFVNNSGQFIQNSFVFDRDVSTASLIMITIEDKRDSDDIPSGTVVLAGDVVNSVAILTADHEDALGTSFAAQSGQFMLMTPSDLDASNETSGVWFATGARTSLSPGLSLPALPSGWAYQGWVDTGDVLLTTGAFTAMDDHDLERPHGLPDAPPFPGEDFLENAPQGITFPADLAGATVWVSAEPAPDDNGVTPYGIRVLSGSIPANPSADTAYSLSSDLQAPSGTATLF